MNYILELILTVAVGMMGAGYRAIIKEIKKHKNERETLQNLLRAQIVAQYMHYAERGEIPLYALDSVETMYKAYTTMGGNGSAEKMVKEIRNLPIRKG